MLSLLDDLLTIGLELMDWKDDKNLVKELSQYVKENVQRREILDFMKQDYGDYNWSMATLDRRLRYFNLNYIDRATSLETIESAMKNELKGPGRLLGYRSMNQKLRQKYGIKVPRHLVYNMLADMDPEGVAGRSFVKKAKKQKIPFISKGSLWVVSVDGHDKLCGFQNSTFPLGIYGFIDTFSRKLLSLTVLFSNSSPLVIGHLYIELLKKLKDMQCHLRMDKGTETGKMATIHSYIISKQDLFNDPTSTVIYGPSTSNNIERWWRDFHERFEKYFKLQLKNLLQDKEYNPNNNAHRKILAYVFIPIVQRECNLFIDIWNTHRIRKQQDIELPTGIPNHMFAFPAKYSAKYMGIPCNDDEIDEAYYMSGINQNVLEYLPKRKTYLLVYFQSQRIH